MSWGFWLALVTSLALVQVAVERTTARLRERHVIICRDEARIWFAASVLTDGVWVVVWFLLGGWTNALGAAAWLCSVNLVLPLGWAWRSLWRLCRAHRDHDEDCTYGPRRRRAGRTAKLRTWDPVALNPAFSPV